MASWWTHALFICSTHTISYTECKFFFSYRFLGMFILSRCAVLSGTTQSHSSWVSCNYTQHHRVKIRWVVAFSLPPCFLWGLNSILFLGGGGQKCPPCPSARSCFKLSRCLFFFPKILRFLNFFVCIIGSYVIAMCQTSLNLAFSNHCFIIKTDLAVSVQCNNTDFSGSTAQWRSSRNGSFFYRRLFKISSR